MSDVLKIMLVFVSMLVLLRLRLNVGYVMLLAAGLLFFLYQVPPGTVVSTVAAAVTDPVTIKLFFSLTLIRVFEIVLRERQILSGMTEASKAFLRSRKAVIISMPVLIGMLPSIGGAYFSAPMVEESTKGLDVTPEEKGFLNYWFRHPWECVLPLYPGILLAAAVSSLELRSLILANMVFAVLVVATGYWFGLRTLKSAPVPAEEGEVSNVNSADPPRGGQYRRLAVFVPLALVIALVMVFHMELHYALVVIISGLMIFFRYSGGECMKALKHGFALDVPVLIFGVMLFKFAMESSGAVSQLSAFFMSSGIPLMPVLFLLPFITGLLTGLTVGFVGSTFPLLINLAGGAHLGQISFAFSAGFAGVLLSPVHLCFVLTREYFKCDAWGIYRKVILSTATVLAGVLAEYLFLSR